MAFRVVLPFARLDFDRHHDGIMVAQAVAVHLGYSIHTDVNAQYGPVTPWVHSLFLNIDSIGPLFALRLANTLFIALTVFFITDLGRIAPSNWKITSTATKFSAVLWIILCDVWIGVTMHPWSSTLAALIVSAALYFLAKSQQKSLAKHTHWAFIWALVSGFLLGIGPFTRLNVGLLSIFATVGLLLIFSFSRPLSWRKTSLGFSIGAAISISSILIYLMLNDSLMDFYNQAIVWPRDWAPEAIEGWKTKENLLRMFKQQSIQALAIIIFSLVHTKFRPVTKLTAYILISVGVITSEVQLATDRFEEKNPEVASTFSALRGWIFQNYLEFFLVLVFISFVALIFKVLNSLRSGLKTTVDTYAGWLILAAMSTSLTIQVVPTWDSRHIWWGIPLGLVVFFSVISDSKDFKRILISPIISQIIFVAILATSSGFTNLSVIREPQVTNNAFSNGMRLSAHEVAWLAADQEFLRNQLGINNKAIFLTWNGYLSVINGSYNSFDEYFLVHGSHSDIGNRLSVKVPIVVEDAIMADSIMFEKIQRDLDAYGYELFAQNLHLFIYKAKP